MISTTANDVNDENVIYSNVNDGSEHFIEGNAKLYDNPNEEVLYAKTFNDTVYFFLDHLKDLNKDEEKPAADQTVYIKFAYRVTNSRYDDMLQKGQKLR
ncbi:hypothetical protein Zmor_011989 [Zophobas morio]|uniref:Uncharacterized protein n=1 Tax=Zophobas morio TaxID=2755281 RepID=A0AA38HHP3_9CUCU|nr:hypothetical protein Zmor_011989 [Zophobas morio]